MNVQTELADRYIATWNETDPTRRRDLIASTWTDTATYLDPMMQGAGHAGIAAMIQGVQETFPGYRFRRTGNVDSHNNHIRFTWELGPEGGPAVVEGTDFGVIAPDARLQAVTGFFDKAPASTAR